jgi:flavin-dependent dehydrogenase
MRATDVAVVGAGPAGSAIAALLARRGLRVVLLERERFPRDKLCGELLSPESTAELANLGVLEEVMAAEPHRIEQARFFSARGGALEVALPGALSLSRNRLDRILFEHAKQSGAETIEEAEVVGIDCGRVLFSRRRAEATESIEAKLAIAAHGRRAKLDKALERTFMDRAHPFVAMKRHHHASPALAAKLAHTVEIHAFDGGYCGLSIIETGEVNACALFEQRFVDAREAKDWPSLAEAMAKQSATLARRFAKLEPSDAVVHAVAQIPFESKERSAQGGRLLFAGDAAGMIAPLAGDGQAMALSSARMLADLIAKAAPALDAPEKIADTWDRAWRRAFDRRMKLGRILQRMLFEPRTADLTIRAVAAIPGLARALTRATRGEPG